MLCNLCHNAFLEGSSTPTTNKLHVRGRRPLIQAKAQLPYSGKLSRDKMFANFADLEPFVKVFSANLKCVSVRVLMRPILPLTHESFLREIFDFHIFAKILSLESFPLYGI